MQQLSSSIELILGFLLPTFETPFLQKWESWLLIFQTLTYCPALCLALQLHAWVGQFLGSKLKKKKIEKKKEPKSKVEGSVLLFYCCCNKLPQTVA